MEPKWPKNYFTYDVTPKKSATLNQKIFVNDIISGVGCLLFWLRLRSPQPKRLESILLKFVLETRLESESFEALTDFLRIRVQKLWSGNNEIISLAQLTIWNR